jgi:hypothetical protein
MSLHRRLNHPRGQSPAARLSDDLAEILTGPTSGGNAEGALLVWKASSTDLGRSDVGTVFALTGSVKKHDEYKGEKQTMILRAKVETVEGQTQLATAVAS